MSNCNRTDSRLNKTNTIITPIIVADIYHDPINVLPVKKYKMY